MDFPFECTRCKRRTYAKSISQAKCCEKASFVALVNICWLLPKTKENQALVHTTGEHPYFRTPVGQEWVVACGRRTKPDVSSPEIVAVTCKKCLEVYDARIPKPSSSETSGVQGVSQDIEKEELLNKFVETENDDYIEFSN